MSDDTVSIIIPVKNAALHLDEQLRAIISQEGAPPPDVVLIDSGSTDATVRIAERYPVRVLRTAPEEFGHGRTRNLGARESRGEYLVFLTQDATPANGAWLRNLLRPLVDDRTVAGSFSRHVPRPGCSVPHARQIEEDWPQCGGLERIVKRVSSREELEARKPFYVYFANTSSCLRRSVWEEFPFRDVEFGEDADWAERVLLAGHALVYEPSSVVLHSHDYSLREQLRQHFDYGRMVRSADLAPHIGAWRSVTVMAGSVRRDARYLRRKGMPLRRLWYSVPFHGACVLGRWLGERSDRLPPLLTRSLSRQHRIKDGFPPPA